MRERVRAVAAVAVCLAMLAGVPPAEAQSLGKCLWRIGDASTGLVKRASRKWQRCIERNLQHAATCSLASDLQPALDREEMRLRARIDAACGSFSDLALRTLGFPGQCGLDVGAPFTPVQLQDCMAASHGQAVAELVARVYGQVADGPPLTDTRLFKCQREIGKQSARFLHKILWTIRLCRDRIVRGDLLIAPASCPELDPKAVEAITKAEQRLRSHIDRRCDDAHLAALDVCNDGMGGPAQSVAEALSCLVAALRVSAERLIDIQYATQPRCGDGTVNTLDEECEPADDAACPGVCGAAGSQFACLCLDRPRLGVIEEADTDLDLGNVHDRRSSAGGHVLDLYDCDGPAGPDVECLAGPHCALSRAPCTSDGNCPAVGDICRKTRLAVGPYCHLDHRRPCASGVDCPGPGNFCRRRLRAPLPLAAGGTSVCLLGIFREDVTGTVNVATGASALRVRHDVVTHLAPAIDQPCPVCGGFCEGPPSSVWPGQRTLCADDGDCPSSARCVTEPICSYGPNVDRPCRPDPPFGGPTGAFGTTSVDCLPSAGTNISGPGLAVALDPATTGTTTLVPDVPCEPAASAARRCVGGASEGRLCASALDCPGGTCNFECFCPGQRAPSPCAAACVGGANDTGACTTDAECPGGFCHPGDCRENPLDPDGPGEGVCTAGPTPGTCSATTGRGCASDADCQTPACPSCAPGETCIVAPQQCFVNSGIVRTGVADPVTPTMVATFCVASTTSAAVNAIAGLPAPGALRQPQSRVLVGF